MDMLKSIESDTFQTLSMSVQRDGQKNREEKLIKQAMRIADNPDGKRSKGGKSAKRSKSVKRSKPVKKTKSFFGKIWDEVEDIFD